MEIPCWCKRVEENFRVEVDLVGLYQSRDEERRCAEIASDLEDLLKEHKDWEKASVIVNYDEVIRCKFCGYEYEPMIAENGKDFVCAYCGKGKIEAAIQVMAESEDK